MLHMHSVMCIKILWLDYRLQGVLVLILEAEVRVNNDSRHK